MNTFPDFEAELKAISPRLTIVQNPNRPGIANIKLDGKDICPIPSGDIRDEPDPRYRYVMPNGWDAPHRSRSEALAKVHDTLKLVEDADGAAAFFGTGDYAS